MKKIFFFGVIVFFIGLFCTGQAFSDSGNSSGANLIMEGESSGCRFGYYVNRAGDVNGDGYDDIIVGATGYNSDQGRAYIYLGGNPMDNIPDLVLTGEQPGTEFGYSVSTAGDINNDGYDDIIVGAVSYNSKQGRAYIYLGGANMDSIPDMVLTGETIDNRFGRSVCTAGDVNGDGYDDVIIGAYFYNSITGKVYIYYGGAPMDGIADVTMTTSDPFSQLGYSVSTAGDVNGDGYDDVIVGANRYNNYQGCTFVYYGGQHMDNIADMVFTGEHAGDDFGWSVSSAGDVNNDGFSDIFVGACYYESNRGKAYIYYGGTKMDNIVDITFTGETTDNYLGRAVNTAGDFNNDGYDDMIIGASRYNDYQGRAYLYYGSNVPASGVFITMTGEQTKNYFGKSLSSAGDVNNDGYDDIIIGAWRYNNDSGRVYLYYGRNKADDGEGGESTEDGAGGSCFLSIIFK